MWNEAETLAAEVLTAARAKGWMIATAESCTGGLVSAMLTEVAGASDVFERGFATYSNEAKTELLGVPAAMIAEHGAVSEQVAAAMAEGALRKSGASLAVSITGVAGPGGTAAKPEGMVCFGLSWPEGGVTETVQFGPLGRANVRWRSVIHALTMLKGAIQPDA